MSFGAREQPRPSRHMFKHMTRVVLVRHGRTAANVAGILAGRQDVPLDDVGRWQCEQLRLRLGQIRPDRIVVSPLVRTVSTAHRVWGESDVPIAKDEGLIECDYGQWQGQKIEHVAALPLWQQVQQHPQTVTFPEGESMVAMAQRAVAAVRQASRDVDLLAVVSHGDVIKAIVADALGLSWSGFQSLGVAPASISVINYADERSYVERLNDISHVEKPGTLELVTMKLGGASTENS